MAAFIENMSGVGICCDISDSRASQLLIEVHFNGGQAVEDLKSIFTHIDNAGFEVIVKEYNHWSSPGHWYATSYPLSSVCFGY